MERVYFLNYKEMAMIYAKKEQTSALVAKSYNELDEIFRHFWGIHLHHGLWETGHESKEEAVNALIEKVAEKVNLQKDQTVCDIGCGYGGTALTLAQQWHSMVTGF